MNFQRGAFISLVLMGVFSSTAWSAEWKKIGESDGITGVAIPVTGGADLFVF